MSTEPCPGCGGWGFTSVKDPDDDIPCGLCRGTGRISEWTTPDAASPVPTSDGRDGADAESRSPALAAGNTPSDRRFT